MSFLSAQQSRRLMWKNLLLARYSPFFGLITGALYLLLALFTRADTGALTRLLDAVLHTLDAVVQRPSALALSAGTLLELMAFGRFGYVRGGRIAGLVHGLAHLLAATCVAWGAEVLRLRSPLLLAVGPTPTLAHFFQLALHLLRRLPAGAAAHGRVPAGQRERLRRAHERGRHLAGPAGLEELPAPAHRPGRHAHAVPGGHRPRAAPLEADGRGAARRRLRAGRPARHPPRSSSLPSWCRGWSSIAASRSRDEAGRARSAACCAACCTSVVRAASPAGRFLDYARPASPSPPQVAAGDATIERAGGRTRACGRIRKTDGDCGLSRARPCCCAATAPRCSARAGWTPRSRRCRTTRRSCCASRPAAAVARGAVAAGALAGAGTHPGARGLPEAGLRGGARGGGGRARARSSARCSRCTARGCRACTSAWGCSRTSSLRGPGRALHPGQRARRDAGHRARGARAGSRCTRCGEGCLLYAHHLCGVEGGVGRARLGSEGRSGLVQVSW